MDYLLEIINQQTIIYNEKFKNKEAKKEIVVPLLYKLTKEQLFQLYNGNNNPVENMYHINSSTGLVVNYFKLFENAHSSEHIKVEFEKRFYNKKPLVSLSGSRTYVGLDAYYETTDYVCFIESKFLEPYYKEIKSGDYYERIKSYNDINRYKIKNKSIAESWIKFLKNEEKFKYFDFFQVYRHLVAIYTLWQNSPQSFRNKKIIFQHICWKMPEQFKKQLNFYEYDSDFKGRCNKFEEEIISIREIVDKFFKELQWEECSVKFNYYSDREILDNIKKSTKFAAFKKQYLLD